ncbi:hypothetical protein Ciccas_012648, partial [Cichlidogyrus casuarinus]
MEAKAEKRGVTIEINKLDANGLAPIHYAARYSKTRILKILVCRFILYSGRDVLDLNLQTRGKKLTALHYLAKYYKYSKRDVKISLENDRDEEGHAEQQDKDGDDYVGVIGRSDNYDDDSDGEGRQDKEVDEKPFTEILNLERGLIDEMKQEMQEVVNVPYKILTRIRNTSVDVNILDSSGKTPLIYAAIHDNYLFARDLCQDAVIKHEVTDSAGKTALMYAAEAGNTKIVRLLSQFRYELLSSPKPYYTVLHNLSIRGNLRAVCTYMLQTMDNLAGYERINFVKESIMKQSPVGYVPIQHAAENGHYAVFKFLDLATK